MPVYSAIDANVYLKNLNIGQYDPLPKSKELKDSMIQGKQQILRKTEQTDFQYCRVIGAGKYSHVWLVKNKNDSNFYALKVVDKAKVAAFGEVEHLKNEKRVLLGISNPFLVSLEYMFQTKDKVCFALPFCNGGDLYNLIRKNPLMNENKH